MGNPVPGKTTDSHGICRREQYDSCKESQCIDGGGQLLFRSIRGFIKQVPNFLPCNASAEYHKGSQFDQGKADGGP